MKHIPLALLAVLLLCTPSLAGDPAVDTEPPSPEQIARHILHGSDAEQAAATTFLESADTKTLMQVCKALQKLAREPKAGASGSVVTMTVRLIEADDVAFRDLGLPGRFGNDLKAASMLLDETQVEILLRACEKGERWKLITAPRVTAYDRQRADISTLNDVSFVSDYEVEVTMGGSRVADPIVETVKEGALLGVTPTLSADRRFVTLDIDGTWAQVERPIPAIPVKVAGDKEVEIQLPTIRVGRLNAELNVPDGGTVLVRAEELFGRSGGSTEHLVMVTAAVTQLDRRSFTEPRAVSEKKRVVNFEVRVIEAYENFLEDISIRDEQDEPSNTTFLDDTQCEVLLRAVEKSERLKLLTAPRLTAYDKQTANVQVLSQISYVKEYTVVEGRDGKTALDPVIDTIQEGVVVELEPTLSADERYVTLDANCTWAELRRPIPELETEIEGHKVKIQVPELSVLRSKTTSTLPTGGTVLIRTARSDVEDRKIDRLVMVTAHVVELEDLRSESGAVRKRKDK